MLMRVWFREDRVGNNAADQAADFGGRRVDFAVTVLTLAATLLRPVVRGTP